MTNTDELEEFDFGDDVDITTFEQILEMDEGDEDDSHEFSKSIVFGFLEQAESTFKKMDTAMDEKDLAELSSLGHFLKGSSATLGYNKVRDECEKIQNYGKMKDETGTQPIDDKEKCLALIGESLSEAKRAYDIVNALMHSYYTRLEGN